MSFISSIFIEILSLCLHQGELSYHSSRHETKGENALISWRPPVASVFCWSTNLPCIVRAFITLGYHTRPPTVNQQAIRSEIQLFYVCEYFRIRLLAYYFRMRKVSSEKKIKLLKQQLALVSPSNYRSPNTSGLT